MYVLFEYLLRLTRCADITLIVRTVVYILQLFDLPNPKAVLLTPMLSCMHVFVCTYV